MMIAQQLYEGIDLGKKAGGITGLITYMRTDSTRVSDTAINQSKDFIIEHVGKEYLGKKNAAKKKADTQDALVAIIPTSVTHDPESLKSKLTNDQYLLY